MQVSKDSAKGHQIPRILIVDDDPLNLEIIQAQLADSPYELFTAENGEQAWDQLSTHPDVYDLVLLDRVMPGLDGLQVLERMKGHEQLKTVPVILQTALSANDEVLDGIRAGAHYYLSKPYEASMLLSVVGNALEDHQRYADAQRQVDRAGRSASLLVDGQFRLQSLEQASDLANLLASAYPEPQRVVVGLSELLMNAVEHGNLCITYQEKTQLRDCGTWQAEVEKRLADPRYADRWVEVHFRRETAYIEVLIRDEGEGFDWAPYMDLDPLRAFDTHGRGIAMSRMVSFDSIEYQGCGNEVIARVYLKDEPNDALH